MEYIIPISRTKIGLPAITETGGAAGKTKGTARLVCRNNGNKKTTLFIPPVEARAEQGHAIFVLQANDLIINAVRSRNTSFTVDVAKFTGYISPDDKATFEVIHSYKNREWDVMPTDCLMPVIEAAKEKTRIEDCQEAAWFEKKMTLPPPAQALQAEAQSPTETFNIGDCGFPIITELKQIAPDEFSLGLSNGIQMLIYVKELPKMRGASR